MTTHSLGNLVFAFFRKYLAAQKNVSLNTIASYSTCVKLLFTFAQDKMHKKIDKLSVTDIDDELVLGFLDHLEAYRKNLPQTRNARLIAIRSFYRFLASQDPELLPVCEKICAIQAKKTTHAVVVSLEVQEVNAFLLAAKPTTLWGARDHALIRLLHNSGARASEAINIRLDDLRLEQPFQVKLFGKGRKERYVPLWEETVTAIQAYLNLRDEHGIQQEHLFVNQRGNPITRFGVGHLITKYKKKAQNHCPSLRQKVVSPHTFRHATALHLIQSGIDISIVKEWLGHANLNTTHLYLEINIEMKREALEACEAPAMKDSAPREWEKPEFLKFLEKLSKCA